ncbi:MAG: hypothetical protein OEM84_12205 [Acidimicrobiia bacterium]|nr:hypothetical protein [Acidimicrobiia bacterium]
MTSRLPGAAGEPPVVVVAAVVAVVVVATSVAVAEASVVVGGAAVVLVSVEDAVGVVISVVVDAAATDDPEAAAVVVADVDAAASADQAASADWGESTVSPVRNQAHPPAAPAPTSTPSIARKLRRLGRSSLTGGDGSSEPPDRLDSRPRSVVLGPLPLYESRIDGPNSPRKARRKRTVFIYYFAQLHQPFDKVEESVCRLLRDLTGWADAAYRDGEELRARVGVGGKRPVIAKTVTLDVGRPVRTPHQTTIPLSWKATGTPALFPQMNADLTVARLGPDMVQIGFSGSYDAPGGSVGQAIDEALLHRIAESSVKGFVDRIAEAVGNGVA